MLRVELLGPVRMFFGGALYAYKAPPKCLPLLGYLLLHRETSVSREALAYSMWADDTEQEARANLRRHLHRLARALPSSDTDWVISDTTTVQWNSHSAFTFDVGEFLQWSSTDGRAEEAVRLYRGELLQGVYEDWVFPERERFRALQIENLNKLVRSAQSDRAFDRAVGFAKELLALDPWRENTLRTLMMLRQAQGDRAGAIAEYEAFAAHLQREMATAPMAQTVGAYEALLRNESLQEVQPADDVVKPTPGVAATLPFAGRDIELDRLSVPWGRAARGHGSAVFISGEAGVGKSRLTQEFGAVATSQGAIVLTGSTALPEAQPYQAIIEILRDALPMILDSAVTPVWLAVLSVLLPEIRVRRPQTPLLQSVEPERERARLFEAIVACILALAKTRPVLMIVEDIQWAGAATTDFVETLARRIVDRPILLVLTYRDEAVERTHVVRKVRRALEREQIASHLALARLDRYAVREIVTKALGEEGASTLGEALFEQSEGNALFLTQAVRNTRDGRAPITAKDIGSVMNANIGRLSDRARTVAQSASVLGRAFDVEVLRELGNWEEHDILEMLDELLDRAIVREASAVHRRDYAFSHNLLQTHVYDTIDAARRTREHRRAAAVMAEIYADALDVLSLQIAQHYELGGRPADAASYFYRAATRAVAIFANEEALEYAQRAAAQAGDPRVVYDAFALREDIHARLGMRLDQRADLERLQETAGLLQSTDAAADAQRRLVRLLHALGERDAERSEIERLQTLAAGLDGAWRAEVAHARGILEMANGNLQEALDEASAAALLFREIDDSRAISAMCLAAEIESARGRFDEALKLLADARAAADEAHNAVLVMRCLNAAGVVQFSRRRFAEARDNALQMLELCEQTGDRQGAASAHARLASAYARMFEYENAQEHYGEAADRYEQMRDRQGEAIVSLNAAVLKLGFGELDAAIKSLMRPLELFEQLGDLRGQALCLGNLSFAMRGSGRLPESVDAGERGLRLALQMRSPAIEAHLRGNIGAAYRDLGDLEAALPHLQLCMAIRRKMDASPDVAEDSADLALAFLIQGRVGDALEIIKDIELYETMNLDAWYPQDAWWIVARVRAAAGDEAGYKEAVRRAHGLLVERVGRIRDPERAEQYARVRYNAEIAAAASTV